MSHNRYTSDVKKSDRKTEEGFSSCWSGYSFYILLSGVLSVLDTRKLTDGWQLRCLNVVSHCSWLYQHLTHIFLYLSKHLDSYCKLSRVMSWLICAFISIPFKKLLKVADITFFCSYFYGRCLMHVASGRKVYESQLRK